MRQRVNGLPLPVGGVAAAAVLVFADTLTTGGEAVVAPVPVPFPGLVGWS